MTTSNDPEEIRREIERTRAELSNDVNALADEAKPANIAKRQMSSAGDSIREGAQNLKEKIMGSDDTYDDYGRSGGRDRGAEAQYAAGYMRAKSQVGNDGPSMGDRVGEARDRVGDAAQDARYQVSRAADDARQQLADAPRQMRRRTQGNPLAAGLVAFGLGALIGGLAPATRQERRAVAEIKDRAEPYVEQAKQQAQEVAQEMKENLQEPAQQAVANVKDSAADSAQTLKEQGQSHAQDVQAHAQEAKDDVQNR